MSSGATEIYLVRHGRAGGDRLGLLLGHSEGTDAQLEPAGREQARELGELLRGRGVAEVLHSPLSRARQTAQLMGARLGVAPRVEPALIEMDHGQATGLPRRLWLARHPPRRPRWFEDYMSFPFPGGESFAGVWRRLRAAFGEWGEAPPPAPVALVTHATCVRLLLALLAQQPRARYLDMPTRPGACYLVRLAPAGWQGTTRLAPPPVEELLA